MSLSPELLLVPFLLVAFLTIHELGHIFVAKLLNLYLVKVGFTKFPFPHVFVEVTWPRNKKDRTFFLLSGFFVIILLLSITLLLGIDYKPLLIAFGIQIIIETNPVYSDFVILSLMDSVTKEVVRTRQPYKKVHQRMYSEYLFSPRWYVHFLLWTLLAVFIIQLLK
jgi:hypothetical protein